MDIKTGDYILVEGVVTEGVFAGRICITFDNGQYILVKPKDVFDRMGDKTVAFDGGEQ
jgi:hypothetical protein